MNTLTHEFPSENEVDQLHPWLGLASFSEETQSFFYGREEEVGELSRRVQRKLLTVLFGQSGLGKTSILRAGIVPRLRGQGYCPVYVRIDYGPDAPSAQEQIKQAIMRETAAAGSWSRTGIAAEDESLWEFLHHRDDVLLDPQGKPVMPLLIFDQFEEIFTLAQGDDDGRLRAANFLAGLAELVENRPSKELEARLEEDDTAIDRFDFARNDYRVLITLREDYLAHLESLKAAMPSITQNRLRLAPMTGTQALAAVTGPGGKLVTQEVAEAIVRFVAGGAELANAQVEPSLLSLICRELNDKRIAANRKEISLDLLAGSHASILTDFYERALVDQPQAVRNVIEDVLLTDSGYRENVAEERVLTRLTVAGALPDASAVLALLVNRRLLRIEDRLDIRRVELTHDVLCGVVKESRGLRHEREEHANTERKLVAQRERERNIRKALVRARQIVTGCVILTVAAIASSIFGYISMKQAQETRVLADSSRNGAEKLVGYLLDDFYTELAPIGRLDMIGELAGRTVNYYQNLPAAMRNTETEANRARALMRLGQVQSGEGKLAEAGKTLDQAISLLEPIVAEKKANEADQLSLASVLTERGVVAFGNGEYPKARTFYDRAISTISPIALASKATASTRIAYAEARTRAGHIKLRMDSDMPGAQAELNAARAVISNVAERQSNVPMMIAYLEAGHWLQETLTLGETKDYVRAETLAEELIIDAKEILRKRPNHKIALKIIEKVTFMRGNSALNQRLSGHAKKFFEYAADQNQEALLRDSGDDKAVSYLAINLGFQAQALTQLGRPLEAKIVSDKIWDLYKHVQPSNFQANNLSSYALNIATIYAELCDVKALATMRSRVQTYVKMMLKGKEAKQSQAMALFYEAIDLALADTAGEPNTTTADLTAMRQRGEQLLEQSKDKETNSNAQATIAIVQQIQAHLAYASGDYEQAEASSRQALSLFLQANPADGAAPTYRMEHALALARLKRLPEASALIKQSLDVQRGQIANGADDQMLRFELAQSLFVSALTQPKAGGKELAEAAALINKLPAALQNYRSVKLWRSRINDEIRLNTRAALGST